MRRRALNQRPGKGKTLAAKASQLRGMLHPGRINVNMQIVLQVAQRSLALYRHFVSDPVGSDPLR